tara:strand:- start:4191 stop:4763 length:573 start_codon:yes stop_codon:yes gene_type:complete
MEVIKKEEFLEKKEFFISEMKAGKIFVYPTDTIYGIGCSGLDSTGVRKIRELKLRDSKPFSVIVPGKDWIRDNCFINSGVESWIAKLPGAYTLILKLRKNEGICSEVNNGGDSLGVRIPDNWFSSIVSECGITFVTTSVNISGEKNLEKLEDLDESIKEKVDYFIDEGVLAGRASTVVDLRDGENIISRE